jgi:eukaryotic-like serine/threonine-protein kinase
LNQLPDPQNPQTTPFTPNSVPPRQQPLSEPTNYGSSPYGPSGNPYEQNPYSSPNPYSVSQQQQFPPPPPPLPRRRVKTGPVIVALILLLIMSSIVGVGVYQNYMYQVNATAAASTSEANETAKAQAYPSYLPGKGTLAFADPLSQESGSQWSAYSNNSGQACQFNGGAYHVSEQQHNVNMDCRARGAFSDFAFEVQLVIVQGDCGGMSIRENGQGQFYNLWICQNGRYEVVKYTNYSGSDAKTLRDSSSSAINPGLGQQNKVAVEASGSIMTFYVNEQQIDQEQDSSYTSGWIGLLADTQVGNVTDVAYSNARLWKL